MLAHRHRRFLIAALATAATLAPAAPASAREVMETVATPPAAGPAQYNQVFVHKFGPASGKRILVLMPGTVAGAGNFTLTARYLVKHVKGLQVWAIDRRTQALERPEMFARALRGEVSLQQMFDHYLGWLANGNQPPDHFTFLRGEEDYPFARRWGMETALNDARAVVLKARGKGKDKREVVLGGHSLGASLTVAYASWDFNGRPGHKDIDGMVLIDGGLLGSFDPINTLAQAQEKLLQLEQETPFADLVGVGIPEVTGLFAEIGAIYAARAPTASAETLQSFFLLPGEFNPPFPVTNRALLANAFDRDTSPQSLRLLHINAGAFAAAGDPRDWVNGGITPVERLVATFAQEPANGVEWYFPRRLTIDTDGADPMIHNDVAQYLGLRIFHVKKVDDPLYALQTDLTHGGVLAGAREFIRRSKTTRKESVLVNADPIQSHVDPLIAAPKQNAFFKTVTKFLREDVFGEEPKAKSKPKSNK